MWSKYRKQRPTPHDDSYPKYDKKGTLRCIIDHYFPQLWMAKDGQQHLLEFEKRAKKYVQHKVEGFCDQSTRNNVHHPIMILLQEMITKLPLDVWLIITLITFELPNISEDNWHHIKQLGCHRLCSAVNMRWPHKWSYSTRQQGKICIIALTRDM